jgi:hypothetical protein
VTEKFEPALDILTERKAQGHKELLNELAGMTSSLNSSMGKGLPQEEMRKHSALKLAVDAAAEALDKLYEKAAG